MYQTSKYQDFLKDKAQAEAESKMRRSNNRKKSPQLLREAGIHFESKSQGVHLIVTGPFGLIDFWPGTGKWICRATGKEDRGVRTLIAYCQNG